MPEARISSFISFNPRTHSGCDAMSLPINVDDYMFQSTHPLGVRPSMRHPRSFGGGFNPRTHSGCDWCVRVIRTRELVSIHAPTRGATYNIINSGRILKVSIHAPTRGATLTSGQTIESFKFQSTHPLGVRPANPPLARMAARFQSTHPLGVRRYFRCFSLRNPCFNPRTHSGCDLPWASTFSEVSGFNPRTHSGCDTFNKISIIIITSFNPRTHSGCDMRCLCIDVAEDSFNPRTHSGCDASY